MGVKENRMKFITCADLHINSKVPVNRKGDYFSQIMNKFEFILKTTIKTDSKILVIAGDFFDSPTVSYKVVRKVLQIIKKYKITILAVPGQHDLRYHAAGLDNTPLGILETAKVVQILKPDSITEINGISFMGCGWNETPSVEADVVVMHLMVTKKDPLWPGQTNYSTAHSILRKYSWAKCIVTGDNHAPHVLKTKSKKLQINCGSMIRSTKTQIDFQPRIQKIDTNDWSVKLIKIPIIDAEHCFDFDKIAIAEIKDESRKLAEEKISAFIDTLPKNEEEQPNFKTTLNNIVAHANPKQTVMDIINNTMEDIQNA